MLPYYCDPAKVGAFALSRGELASGNEAAMFRLFVALSMFQGLRDVVIMKRQRALAAGRVASIASVAGLRRAVAENDCPALGSVTAFDEGCDVAKDGESVDCGHRPGARCHVKLATAAFKRMGDMGKLPTSAWLHFWRSGGLRGVLVEVLQQEPLPAKRAVVLVERLARVHRVGRKLATMFVSALSTPALAPELTPWFPAVDGNELVVIDTNVARAVDVLRKPGAPRTYDARERWLREQAARLDLRQFHPEVPSYSPRLVQQALYAFCSKSNRAARGDACAGAESPCTGCALELCPFGVAGR
ncbi:Hypothetical protein AA314_08586 [Archangium gephyra]|uniref:Uncharacterized protein n=1 Tax=Archangium gephyra TaxID=48 RepID=A0AAC8TIL7_9BACT|nr:Hypothetical protein AA314_08586 [Archangium gephyra]